MLEERLAAQEEDQKILTERAEEIILLGSVAEAIDARTTTEGIFESLLERIAILKDVPYCSIGHLQGEHLTLVNEFAVFRDEAPDGATLQLSDGMIDALHQGHLCIGGSALHRIVSRLFLAPSGFVPKGLLLLPFSSVACKGSCLGIFADDARDPEELDGLKPLLDQAINHAVARLEAIALLEELERLNATLDDRVKERTRDLADAYRQLEVEVEERRLVEEQLRQAATVFDNTSEGVIITDLRTTILAVNPAFCEVTGYAEGEVLGQTTGVLASGRHPRQFYDEMWASIGATGRWRGEIWNRRKNGEVFPELLNISEVRDEDGKLTHYVGVFSDISALKESQARLQHLAHHDPLTGLPNRLLLHARMEHALIRARRTGERVAVLFLDLDRFKAINDTFGHPVGDRFLQAVADRLTAAMREDDTVARLGGDEFVILVEGLEDPLDAAGVAEKTLEALRHPVLVDDAEIFTSASIGIAVAPDDGKSLTVLLRNADGAMYQAKDAGRNTFKQYTAELSRGARERFDLESALRRALGRSEFILHFQPLLELSTDSIVGVEALVRWQHPELGLTLPDTFIELAEDIGLIHEIDRWVLEQACRRCVAWNRNGRPSLRMAVNVSGRDIMLSALFDTVSEVIEATGVDPGLLELEITESFVMHEPEQVIETLVALKSLGITLAIDDFGAGFTSLAYLKRFPIDRFKIDSSIIVGLPESDSDRAIAQAVITLGHNLHLPVVAEGVETADQLSFLRSVGCDEVQGFLLCRPLSAPDFERVLESGRPLGVWSS